MDKYRPDGWEQTINYEDALSAGSAYWYNLGADAMLEALRKMGSPIKVYENITTPKIWNGIQVVIPDDKE